MRPIATLLVAALAGCSKAPPSPTPAAAKPGPATPVAQKATPNAAKRPPWAVDRYLADRLTQSGSFGDYELQLPSDFKPLPTPKSPGAQTVWRGPDDEEHLTLLIAKVMPDANKFGDLSDMRQFLVDFSAGVTDPLSVKIQKRGPTETGELAGLKFSRFTWTGRAASGLPASGAAYAAVHDNELVTFVLVAAGTATEDSLKLMESSVASLKKK